MSSPDILPAFSDSDQRWLDALAAPTGPGDESSALLDAPAQEALLLQKALGQEQSLLENSAGFQGLSESALRERKLQALLLDLRRQGLLPPMPGADAPRRRWWSFRARWPWAAPVAGAIAAALLVFAVVWPPLARPPAELLGEPPVWRGGQPETVRQVPAPLAQAQAMRERLGKAGVWAALYQQGQDFVLDVDVDAAQLSEVGPMLVAEGLTPRAGMARIRFVKN